MTAPRVALHFNAGLEFGMGHLMRSIALGIEASAQSWDVTVAGDVDDVARSRLGEMLPQASVIAVPRAEQQTRLLSVVKDAQPDVIHIDSYWPESGALAAAAPYLSNMQDGPFGSRPADLAVDANLGAEFWFDTPAQSARHLAGASSAVIRPQVLRHRRTSHSQTPPSRVLIVLGGTDPHGLTPSVIDALPLLGAERQFTVIAPEAVSARVHERAAASAADITILPFVRDLPALAGGHDFVITAAGTSVWDFACMGVPMALLCVTDNQRLGYRAAEDAGIGFPLGEPPHHDLSARFADLAQSLAHPDQLSERVLRGQTLIDGYGAWRIVSAWSQRDQRRTRANTATARPATVEDARLLLDWRNDPTTRSVSRSTEEITWETHVAWLTSVLADPERSLHVVEDDGRAIGTVRGDHLGGIDWEVSITVAPELRGRGRGGSVLSAGERALLSSRPTRLIATIHDENTSSRRLFENAGYLPHRPADTRGFAQYARLVLADS